MAWALLARDSEAAEERVLDTLEAGSNPIPNVLTNFLTKLNVWGVIRAAGTARKQRTNTQPLTLKYKA